jgi:hypothetical protein
MATNMDLVRKKFLESQNDDGYRAYDSFKFFKPVEGTQQIRIIPAHGERGLFWLERYCSWKVGPKNRMVYPLRQFKKQCPLQDYIDYLKKLGDDASVELARTMQPKLRALFWLIDRGNEEQGPQLWNAPYKNVLTPITGIMADPDYGDITDVVEGRDLNLTYTIAEKSRSGFPDYFLLPKGKACPLGTEEQIAEWTKEDLFVKYKIGVEMPASQIQAILDGTDEGNGSSGGSTDPFGGPQEKQQQLAKPEKPEQKYWTLDASNEVQEITKSEIEELIRNGTAPHAIALLDYAQKGEWVTAADFGFGLDEKPAKPSSPKPASKPVPPKPKNDVSESTAGGDFNARVAAIRAKTQQKGDSVDDLKAALKSGGGEG